MYTQAVGKRTAEEMGVHADPVDAARFAAVFAPIAAGVGALGLLSKLPQTKAWADDYAIKETNRQLAKEGEAEYKTDDKQYNYTA